MSDNTTVPWRVGTKYGVHVYAGAVPVATFHTSMDAAEAVLAHNAVLTGVLDPVEAKFNQVFEVAISQRDALRADVERLRIDNARLWEEARVALAERAEARATIERVKALAFEHDPIHRRDAAFDLHVWFQGQVWVAFGAIRAALEDPTEVKGSDNEPQQADQSPADADAATSPGA